MSAPAGQSNPEEHGFNAIAARVRQMLESGDFENPALARILAELEAYAKQKSQSRDTSHYDPYDVWRDLEQNLLRTRPELKTYQESASHVRNGQGDPFQATAEESKKKLEGLAKTVEASLDTAIASGE